MSGETAAERIRVRGAVQGVGFRPMVWRLARDHGLRGWVGNDAQGVIILAGGPRAAVEAFARELPFHAPPLARIEAIERESLDRAPDVDDFSIVASQGGVVATRVVADAATCPECLAEIRDAAARRYRYPFTNCTHCGPRLSIIEEIPYDRALTTMREFSLCPACSAEYHDPEDRRFHAQPIACPACGPRVWLEDASGAVIDPATLGAVDALDAAAALIGQGKIVAVKGLGGFQLACDATDETAVASLRRRKRRESKPFALMARDVAVVRRYCDVAAIEEQVLASAAAPIVVLPVGGAVRVAVCVAPGMRTLGFMLPNSPLHHLLLQGCERPIVLTSGNLSDEPQCIDNEDARQRLAGISGMAGMADAFLMHDRGIARRVDDSVVRIAGGKARVLRRARGDAPAPVGLPDGFAAAPPVLALGGELKNTFCLLRDGEALLSHHMGDLADARCHADFMQSLAAYEKLFEHAPRIVAVDRHPEYLSRKLGLALAETRGLKVEAVQHHHAHIAACLAENGVPLDSPPVFGIALDGLGYGDDGALWGGEILLADYRHSQRVATLQPAALPGGERAIYEPWRNAYARLFAHGFDAALAERYRHLDFFRCLAGKPHALLDTMMAQGINSPLASSCGRLFDAVAALAGVCCERVAYEGQAAAEFEALIDARTLARTADAQCYPFVQGCLAESDLPCLDPSPLWPAVLDDLAHGVPLPAIAARFHKGLAMALVHLLESLRSEQGAPGVVALSGGVFQNRTLLEEMVARLEHAGFCVLTHSAVPTNDGGLALGQGAVAAARALAA